MIIDKDPRNYQITMRTGDAARQRRAGRRSAREPVAAIASDTLQASSPRPAANTSRWSGSSTRSSIDAPRSVGNSRWSVSSTRSSIVAPPMENYVSVPMRTWHYDKTITVAAPGQAIRTTGLSDCHAVFVASQPDARGQYNLIGVHLTGGAFDGTLAHRLLEASGHGPTLVFYVEGLYQTPMFTRGLFEQLKNDLDGAARALKYDGAITASHFVCPQTVSGDVEVTPTAQINFPGE